MTSKEKANKLVSEFHENVYPNTGVAIEAVKFTVNEILNQYNTGKFDYKILDEDELAYWLEVKEELSKI